MLRRYALAPLQGLALFGLSIVGFAQFVVSIVVSCTGFIEHFEKERWLPNLCRRLVGAWSGVEIQVPYRPKPPPPEPGVDGWYRDGDLLSRWAGLMVRWQRFGWLMEDPATHRDHLWAMLTPVTGGLAAGLPAGLITLGFFTPPLATVGLVVLGIAGGPSMLWLYSRWAGAFLGPAGRTGRHPVWERGRSLQQAMGRLAATVGLSIAGIPYAAMHVVITLPGFTEPLSPTARMTRALVNLRRKQIFKWTGIQNDEPYLPPPPLPTPRPDGKYQVGPLLVDSPHQVIRMRVLCTTLKDKATWRDLAWLILDPLLTIPLIALPVILGVVGFFVFFVSWVWSLPVAIFTDVDPRANWAYLGDLIPGLQSAPHWLTPVAGVVMTLVALLVSQVMLKVHGRWSRLLLAPTKSAVLARRVAQLTETRADATDTQAAELRRIECDLHDGAQARWVAMGLNLGAVEHLIDRDPDTAKKLVANARDASAEALVELRQLVRGILPPVLAERGLGDAVRALALDSALNVHVAVELAGRVAAPLEAAVYFAISELLTNAAKHAKAERVSVDIRHINGRLRVAVVDDGQGGADPAAGSGLQGLQRRLATFDGVIVLTSPLGGPTTATLEVPCALSSPRTSTSSETA